MTTSVSKSQHERGLNAEEESQQSDLIEPQRSTRKQQFRHLLSVRDRGVLDDVGESTIGVLESRFPRGAECGEEAPSLRTRTTARWKKKSHDQRTSASRGPGDLTARSVNTVRIRSREKERGVFFENSQTSTSGQIVRRLKKTQIGGMAESNRRPLPP